LSGVLRTLTVICVGGLAAGVSPALGAFPGANGRIAFMSDRTGDEEIFHMSTDGSQQTNLTNNPFHDFHQSVSPDGGRIVFSSFRDAGKARDDPNYGELYVIDASGSRRITFNGVPDHAPAWSPDGKWLVFARTAPSTNVEGPLPPGDLWIRNLETARSAT
jgi:Tol biopolymer transport system component